VHGHRHDTVGRLTQRGFAEVVTEQQTHGMGERLRGGPFHAENRLPQVRSVTAQCDCAIEMVSASAASGTPLPLTPVSGQGVGASAAGRRCWPAQQGDAGGTEHGCLRGHFSATKRTGGWEQEIACRVPAVYYARCGGKCQWPTAVSQPQRDACRDHAWCSHRTNPPSMRLARSWIARFRGHIHLDGFQKLPYCSSSVERQPVVLRRVRSCPPHCG